MQHGSGHYNKLVGGHAAVSAIRVLYSTCWGREIGPDSPGRLCQPGREHIPNFRQVRNSDERCSPGVDCRLYLVPMLSMAQGLFDYVPRSTWNSKIVALFILRITLFEQTSITHLCCPTFPKPASFLILLYSNALLNLDAFPYVSSSSPVIPPHTHGLPSVQYTKYDCVRGSSELGSAVHTWPSASTVYRSGSTLIFGITSL